MKQIIKIESNLITGLMLLVVILLYSCRVTENYKRPSNIADNKLYRDANLNDTINIADIPGKEFSVIPCCNILFRKELIIT